MTRLSKIASQLATVLIAPLTMADNGHYAPGAEGIGGAQVPAPGLYYRAYATQYDIKAVVDQGGHKASRNNKGHVSALTSRLVWITERKLLGADYGVEMIVPVLRTSLNFNGLGAHNSDSGVGDVFLSPLILGWHGNQWDAVAGAGLWLDNGSYSRNNPASVGKGYRTTMLTLGGSWHFDPARRWSLSALSRYEINGKQEYTGIRPADNWLIEWGFEHRLDNGIELGFVGYDSWQLDADRGAADNAKAQRHAVGLESAYRWAGLGVGLNAALYHEYHVEAGSNGVAPEGNTIRLVLTKSL